MTKFFISVLGILITTSVLYSQSVQVWTENFDGNISFTATPSSAWEKDSNYSVSSSYACLGNVLNMAGERTILESPIYDFSAYNMVATVTGDSLWEATIPQFKAGTTVFYSIAGKDMSRNQETIASTYTILTPPPGITGTVNAGVYFYSMESEGHRAIKRMNIKR